MKKKEKELIHIDVLNYIIINMIFIYIYICMFIYIII